MREILEKYSTRLINISGKNRSLVMRRLYNKRSFDIAKLDEFNNSLNSNVVDFLKSRDEKTLKISEDPYKWFNNQIDILKRLIKKERELSLKNEALKENSKGNIDKINEFYDKKTLEEEQKLIKKQETLISYNYSIKSLMKEINKTEKETGRYELYIGYPFVEGYFKDKTFTKAPLFLFPIKAINKSDVWYIENIVDMPVILNKVFLIAYAKFNEEKLADIETEYNDLSIFGEDLIKGTIDKLKDDNIFLKYTSSKITTFNEITAKTKLNYNLGEIEVKNNLVMGHFNLANSIYNDYKEMETNDLSSPLIEKLLLSNSFDNNTYLDDDNKKGEDIVENQFHFISNLDYSQEIAVKKADESDNLLIYGPPGTGKSQTIVNIVSQYLSKGKKVLVVSQKKAALDVIMNRSSSINSKMIIFNKDIDKKKFYQIISNRIDSLEKDELNKEKINTLSYTIENNVNKLKKLSFILTEKTYLDLSLQEMYLKKNILDGCDKVISDFFREFRRDYTIQNYAFKDYTFHDLEDISKKLTLNNIAFSFYELKKIARCNEYFFKLKENINNYDIEDAKVEVDNLYSNYDTLLKSIKSEIKFKLEVDKVILNNESIDELAKYINNNINSNLLIKYTNGSKFSIKYWLNLKKNKAKEEENLVLFKQKEEEIKEYLYKDIEIINKHLKKFDFLKLILKDINEENFIKIYDNITLVKEKLYLIKDILDKYNDILELDNVVSNLSNKEKKLLDYIYSKDKNYNNAYKILENIHLISVQVYINNLENSHKKEIELINNFDYLTKEIIDTMEIKRNEVSKFINQKWDNIALEIKKNNLKNWSLMYRECNKKRKLLEVREFIRNFSEYVLNLYPCWLLSPESVSEVLPLEPELFDIIIFDEASQMYIENAIPTIYRGKKIVVAGDDKQLRPTGAFSGKYEDDEEYDLDISAALEEESLLDLAKYSFDSTSLYYHYRSKYDELINFSNYAFYNGKLEVSPNISKSNDNNKAIERIKVDGLWIDRTNKKEALEVVNLVKHILRSRKENETIGIITFNINQRDLIEDLLELEAGKDSDFGKLYFSEIDRIENSEDVSLFVKNIENVQGDERDIIIFSTAYAKDERGRILQNFGTLNQDGGENRLNVAISRAKKKIYLITSIEPDDLNVEKSKNNGPKLFKKYLQYVKTVSEGNEELSQEILFNVCDSSSSRNKDVHYDSDFEKQVREALLKTGLKVDTQIGVSGYKIDLAIYDDKKSKYILGIECDGAAYHSSKSARERDIYRQRYLESRGWNITRIWSKNWWNNPKGEVSKIVSKVNSLNKNNDVGGRTYMNKCLNCGIISQSLLCSNCNTIEVKERLCNNLIKYPFVDLLPSIDEFSKEFELYNVKGLLNDLSNYYDGDKKKYYKLMSLARTMQVDRNYRENFSSEAMNLINSDEILSEDKELIMSLLLNTYQNQYNYNEAENIANVLSNININNWNSAYALGEYYTLTRRYENALKFLKTGLTFKNNEKIIARLNEKIEDCNKRFTGEKKGYMPNPIEGKKSYTEFIESLNISIDTSVKRTKNPFEISKEDYPKAVEMLDTNFNSFIAFDLETTGFAEYDEITEIGAVKVVDGKIVDRFSTLVKPRKKLSNRIIEITNITNEMLENEPSIEEVFPKFIEFVGDEVLLGHNVVSFDSKFIMRAGRKQGILINNKFFDVMKLAKNINKSRNLFSNAKLGTLCDHFGISNIQAHRALSDAEATSKVYFELLKIKDR